MRPSLFICRCSALQNSRCYAKLFRMATHVPHITTPVNRIGVGEAARITGLHPDTIRRAADSKKIGSIRTPGGHRQLDLDDVVALAEGTLGADEATQTTPHVAGTGSEAPVAAATIVEESSGAPVTGAGENAGAARAHTTAPAPSRADAR